MTEIQMPRLSDTMEEGTLSRWLKQEGDQIQRGDVIAEIETDKAMMELEAYDDGPLTRILVQEGESVPIGTPVAIVGEEPESAPAAPEAAPEQTTEAPAPSAAERPEQPARPSPGGQPERGEPTPSGRVPTSPLARLLAGQHGIDIANLTGSGPGGRVVRADVDEAIAQRGERPGPIEPPTAPRPAEAAPEPAREAPRPEAAAPAPGAREEPESEEVPLSNVRRITAQRLTQSTQQAPHFYLTSAVDAEPLLAFRAEINQRLGEQGPRISVNDLIVKACAVALRAHPEVNASWDETRILRHRRVHVGIAVALDDGLTVPVVHDADRKPLTAIAEEAHTLAAKARSGHLSLDQLSGGTFTVSNLGPYGIDHFTAVINPPQAAILAVGAAQPKAVVREGGLEAGTTMALTLSIDHRVLDGASGAAFLADLGTILENPLRIVV
ncbi:dihydrolipoamide acetyltransferase family protein [Streptomyces sp. TP-A0874]|uniref:dihydrolipoamide acetyltransferase family protein n=1 Tax=Streptomyces sp. TP-A0874 TaxID=549819 RepID=UPI000853D875|nr:dihydrolipoamide acetyltransferase family protein [Streptomyces sp. TP-A0874]